MEPTLANAQFSCLKYKAARLTRDVRQKNKMNDTTKISVKCQCCNETIEGHRYHGGFSDIHSIHCSRCEASLWLCGDSCEPKFPNTSNIMTSDYGREWLPYWDEFDSKLPKCKCGGTFNQMNSPRCPKCKGLIFGELYEGKPVYRARDIRVFDFGKTYKVKDLI